MRLTMKERLDRLEKTAQEAVSYVGAANYDHRERAAHAAVAKSRRTGTLVYPQDMEKE